MTPTQTVAARARAVADDVTERLADPAQPASADGWSPESLDEGNAGIALLHADAGDADGRRLAHEHLAAGLRGYEGSARCALFNGDAALGFAARFAAAGGDGYTKLLRTLDERIGRAARRLAEALSEAVGAADRGLMIGHYDVITGLAGLGRYLLAAGPDQRPALEETLTALVRLTEPVALTERTVPGWWVRQGPGPGPGGVVPAQGLFDLGMAHGIAGPLALLAIAYRQDVRVPGQADAVSRVGRWLAARVASDESGPYWPTTIGFTSEFRGEIGASPPTRAAWCYGTPGVARALQLAAPVAGEPGWADLAVTTLRSVLDGPVERWRITNAGLCHGAAGLLHVTSRVAEDSGDAGLRAHLPSLAERVLAHHDPDAPYGFRRHRSADLAGVLEGASGVALALRHFATAGSSGDAGRALHWDAALLLS